MGNMVDSQLHSRKRRGCTPSISSLLFLSMLIIFIIIPIIPQPTAFFVNAMDIKRRIELREKAKEMFYHAYNSYMEKAFPLDELNPITCLGEGPIYHDKKRWGVNDVRGNYSLTLVDTLDTLCVLGNVTEFHRGVKLVIENVSFDSDAKVDVFEVSIRVLGGLLSSHLLAHDQDNTMGCKMEGYNGELLAMAKDLAERLLPAFYASPTKLPLPRVNLKRGVLQGESTMSNAASGGTLILEYGTLSRLTGDPRFEKAAKDSLNALWNLRSNISLFGTSVDANDGEWKYDMASIGAGFDSFLEYLLKAYVLFGEKEYLEKFDEAYKAILEHMRHPSGFYYKNVQMSTGALINTWVDSLSAFLPGLQVLAGDIPNAIKSHLLFFTIWKKFNGLPERFDVHTVKSVWKYYPLRPELIESTLFLYQATKNPWYLEAGEKMLLDINNHARTKCGFATINDVERKVLDNRMESFFLSETLKYLYLLFDEDNIFNKEYSNSVYTTEAHFLRLPTKYLKPSVRTVTNNSSNITEQCSNIASHNITTTSTPLINKYPLPESEMRVVYGMVDLNETELGHYTSPHTQCDIYGKHRLHGNVHQVTLPKLDNNFTPKFAVLENIFVTESLQGASVIIKAMPNGNYRITQINGYTIANRGRIKVFEDGIKFLNGPAAQGDNEIRTIRLWSYVATNRTVNKKKSEGIKEEKGEEREEENDNDDEGFVGTMGRFGKQLTLNETIDYPIVFFRNVSMNVNVTNRTQDLYNGCSPFTSAEAKKVRGKLVMVRRGDCMFAEKTRFAEVVKAAGVLIVNYDDSVFEMMGDNGPDPKVFAGLINNSTGAYLMDLVTDNPQKRIRIKVKRWKLADEPSFWIEELSEVYAQLKGKLGLQFYTGTLENVDLIPMNSVYAANKALLANITTAVAP